MTTFAPPAGLVCVGTTNGIVPGSGTGLSDGVATVTTDRTRYVAPTNSNITDICMGFCNSYAIFDDLGEYNGPNPITLQANIEYPAKSNTVYPVTFGGSLSIVIQPGQLVYNDPHPITITKATDWDVRCLITVNGGEKWPTHWGAITSNFGESAGVNLTQLTGAITVTSGFMYSPVQVLGRALTPSAVKSYIAFGDSIMHGLGDGTVTAGFYGPPARANNGVNGLTKCAKSSESAAGFNVESQSRIRRQLARNVSGLYDVAFLNHASNDFIASQTAAQLIANQLLIIAFAKTIARKVVLFTCLPRTTSTGSVWISEQDQTPSNGTFFTTQRNIYNAWCRAAVAAGIVDYLFDVDYMFAGTDPYQNVWRGNKLNGKLYQNDGIHPNSVGNIAWALNGLANYPSLQTWLTTNNLI